MTTTAYRCPKCQGQAAIVKAPGRGARKYQCQEPGCRYEELPFTLAQSRRQRKTAAIVARRIHRANQPAGWWAA